MATWSFDILRQGGWDLWVWVCIAAAGVLAMYGALGQPWRRERGVVLLGLIAAGVAGTIAVVAAPALHSPWVGLAWTFLLLAILSTVFYLNLQPQLGAGRMAGLLGMRLLALVLLVPMLFEPVVRYVERPRPERPLLLLVDTSGSMSFPDVQNGPTRLQSVWQALAPQLPTIRDHFVPQVFTFSNAVDTLDRPDALAATVADGPSTDIVNALSRVLSETSRDDAAVILVSDGIDNTSPDVVDAARASRRPIHTVAVGSEQAESALLANLAIDNVETRDDFVVDHQSKVKVTVKSSALANRVVDVKLAAVDESGKPIGKVATEKLVLQPIGSGQVVELSFTPKSVGVQRLAVWVDPIAGERSTIDNRQEFQGLALDPRIKVLYIEGRARPEYRELNRALNRDANIEVASLLRIQEDRFAASGTVDGEPFKSMPASLDQWRKFDVILLGDLDGSFLSKPQQAAIEAAVSDGTGLLMIGGQNSFGPGGYAGTAVEKALPVAVGDLNAAQETTPFVPRLTAEGLVHPAMQGLADWFGSSDQPAKQTLPPLRGNVVVNAPKSGAQVLLVHPERPGPNGQPQIVLAVHPYGQGRAAAFTADTTYLWYLPMRGMGQDSPYNRFWGQLIRWLAAEDVRQRGRGAGVEGLLNKTVFTLGEPVRVRANVRDDKGEVTRYAQVSLTLTDGNGGDAEPKQFPLSPTESRLGMYDVTIPNLPKGQYTARIVASKDGKELGRQALTFSVIAPAEEMLKIAANPKLLAGIAQETGGFHYPLAQLPTLIDELIRTDPTTAKARERSVPLSNVIRVVAAWTGSAPQWPKRYDLPMQGALVIALLAGEWILRRRWQLP